MASHIVLFLLVGLLVGGKITRAREIERGHHALRLSRVTINGRRQGSATPSGGNHRAHSPDMPWLKIAHAQATPRRLEFDGKRRDQSANLLVDWLSN